MDMNAEGPAEQLPFSEEEMFRAMRLVLPEDEAREMARHWASIPDKIERGDAIGWGMADGTYDVALAPQMFAKRGKNA